MSYWKELYGEYQRIDHKMSTMLSTKKECEEMNIKHIPWDKEHYDFLEECKDKIKDEFDEHDEYDNYFPF